MAAYRLLFKRSVAKDLRAVPKKDLMAGYYQTRKLIENNINHRP